MAGRIRTTKKLSQRINREYFKKRFPLVQWRLNLSIVFVALGVIWLGWAALARSEKPYNAGPITASHALFSQRCSDCHVQSGIFTNSVTDQSCNSCHNGPIHQENQVSGPACVSCHMEHKGKELLAHTSDNSCTQCHADLKVKSGVIKVAAKINSFSDGHPEFTPRRAGFKDEANIKFNHNTHLRKAVQGPKGSVQLKCGDCHRAGVTDRPWPYGSNVNNRPSINSSQTNAKNSHRALMEPVDYYENCSACHPLQFDKRIQDAVPHNKKPEEVRAYMKTRLEAYIGAHPNEIPWVEPPNAQLPTRPPEAPAKSAAEWVQRRMNDAELLLWNKTCKECHSLTYASAKATPEVPKVNFTTRWLKKGSFDHQAHQMVQCESCHTNAAASKLTSDVLIPDLKSCQSCHKSGTKESANASCYECHQYHDWKKEVPVDAKYTISQLENGAK